MPKLFLSEQDAQWFDVDIEPFAGDVRLRLYPATRALLDRVQEKAKHNPKYRRHSVIVNGQKIARDSDQQGAWLEEFMREVIADWEGVEDETGPIPCTDENKPRVLQVINLINWIQVKASLIAGAKVEEEEKN